MEVVAQAHRNKTKLNDDEEDDDDGGNGEKEESGNDSHESE